MLLAPIKSFRVRVFYSTLREMRFYFTDERYQITHRKRVTRVVTVVR